MRAMWECREARRFLYGLSGFLPLIERPESDGCREGEQTPEAVIFREQQMTKPIFITQRGIE
jgi:hypothetical protein